MFSIFDSGGLSEIAKRKVRKIIDELLNGEATLDTLPNTNIDEGIEEFDI